MDGPPIGSPAAVTLAEPRPATSDGRARKRRIVVYGATPLSRAVAGALERVVPGPEVVVLGHPDLDAPADPPAGNGGPRASGHGPDPSAVDADVVVATCAAGLAEALVEVSRTARAAGVPFVPVWMEGLTGHVGPSVSRNGGPCLRCYLLRRASNDTRWEVTDAVRRVTTRDPVGRRSHAAHPLMPGALAELCALEVRRLLEDEAAAARAQAGRALELNLVAFSAATRLVLPVPRCPECDWGGGHEPSEDPVPEGHTEDQRLRSLLAAWPLIVDPQVGVVRKVEPLPVEDDEPAFVHYLSTASDSSVLTGLKNFANNGGVSTTHPGAVAKAVGEGVERYCSAFFRYEDLTAASYRDLPGRGTPPADFALYTPEQLAAGNLPWTRFADDVPVRWTTGRSLVTGEPVFVPAAMVYVPYHFLPDGRENGFTQPISTGLAAGTSFADAALSGLCEAVERDAFTITWQARLRRPHVDETSLPEACSERLRRFTDAGLRVEIMDITTDIGLPTLLTIALGNRPTSPAVAVAAATHPDPAIALIKSLEELAHTRKFARQVMDYTPPLPVDVEGGHPEVSEQKHHLRFYCPQEAKRFARFAWSSPDRRRLDEVGGFAGGTDEQLAAAVRAVRAAGLEPIACDLTTPDVAQLGLRVVRVVVPGLHPLFMGHRNRALGGHRLAEVPALLGEPGIRPGEADNPYPHPFP